MGRADTDYLKRDCVSLAFRRSPGKEPTIVWCGGFRSDMAGTKAEALHEWAEDEGRAFLRFDYAGHGESGGDFADGTISSWTADAEAVIGAYAGERPLLVGSSMGGWIALLLALRRPVSGLVLLAPAPDFTERLLPSLPSAYRAELEQKGRVAIPSAYSPDSPTIFTRALIEDGRRNLILNAPIAIDAPVRILHGQADPDVPWQGSLDLAARIACPDVHVHLVKDGDHRLSRPADIALLVSTVADMSGRV